jgi:hypothetical protein
MSYASINLFRLKPGSMDTFLALNQDEFLPLLRRQPGFEGLELVRTGADTGVATLWWASYAARHAATPALQPWVDAYLEPYFVSLDNPAGPVTLSWRHGGSGAATE